ncbi:hypothetical protein HK096_008176 [Nowakowskiella sp. JEL0078]|nr:hypothetical protein HK096_008176 [Nowakowskiella sp. JEL0078]
MGLIRNHSTSSLVLLGKATPLTVETHYETKPQPPANEPALPVKRRNSHRRAVSMTFAVSLPKSLSGADTPKAMVDMFAIPESNPSSPSSSPRMTGTATFPGFSQFESVPRSPKRTSITELSNLPSQFGPFPICHSLTAHPTPSNILPLPNLKRHTSLKTDAKTSPYILHLSLINSCASLDYLHALLHRGAMDNINTRDNHGRTPLHIAVTIGSVSITRLLLSHGADPNVRRKDRRTALHLAAAIPSFEMCALLLAHRADATAVDVRSRTPLLDAVESGHYDTVKLLLDTCAALPREHRLAALQVSGIAGTARVFKLLLDELEDSVDADVVCAAAYGGDLEIAAMVCARRNRTEDVGRAVDIALQNAKFGFATALVADGGVVSDLNPVALLAEWIDNKVEVKRLRQIAEFCVAWKGDGYVDDDDVGDTLWALFVQHWNDEVCRKAGERMLVTGYRPAGPVSGMEQWIITEQDDVMFNWVAKTKNVITEKLPVEVLARIRFWVYANDVVKPYCYFPIVE